MSKLVDKERLAKLAAALDKRAKDAVKAEADRALAAEQAIEAKADANTAAIAAIKNEETGLLAQAKSHAQGLVDGEKEDREEAEGLLDGRIKTLEGIVGTTGEAGALGKVITNVAENTAAIATLKGDANTAGSVAKAVADAVKVEEDRAKEVEEDHETRIAANEAFVEAQPDVDKAQNDRLAVIEEMMGLGGATGDKTALQELQDSIDAVEDKADQAQREVDAVEERMNDAESDIDQLQTDVTKLNGDENTDGSVKKQIANAIATVNQAAEALEDRVAANEAFVAGYAAKEADIRADFAAADTTLEQKLQGNIDKKVNQSAYDTKVGALEDEDERIAGLVASEAQTARAAEQALAAKLAIIEGADTVEGSIAKAEKDAKAYADELVADVNTAAGNLEDRVEANEAKLAGLANATVKAEIEAAQAAAEKHADDAITALVDSAPEAMNTLNELAKAIKDNKDIYDGYIAEHATAMASMKSELQKEIDDDVAAEKALRVAEEAKIRGEFAAADATLKADLQKEIDDDVKVEKERAVAEEAKIRGEFAAADTALSNRIKVFEAGGTQDVAAKEVRLAAAETFIQEHSHEELQAEIDAAEGRIGALETFKNGHSHSAMEKGIADNKAAIEKEVEDRDAAIATALATYSTTAEMKQVIGNVVNSLALTMENDKVVLKLGGKDGIALAEVSLDMATDDDIDTIIAGLDA